MWNKIIVVIFWIVAYVNIFGYLEYFNLLWFVNIWPISFRKKVYKQKLSVEIILSCRQSPIDVVIICVRENTVKRSSIGVQNAN